jgi:Arc/MetJ-type ribon-helix-helix transcriptional regulator
MARPERSGPPDEKVTINLGPVDLGRIDLLVEEGFYGSRTDFIRDAIRRLLEEHKTVLSDATVRREVTVGFVRLGSGELERAAKKRETLDIRVVGRLEIDDDVSPELADKVIGRISVRGSLQAPRQVLDRLGERVVKGGRRA